MVWQHTLSHTLHTDCSDFVCAPSLLAKILEAFTDCQHGSITAGSERPPFSSVI